MTSYKQGQTIFAETPYAAIVDDDQLSSVCSFCFEELIVLPCSKCQYVSYCSPACTRSDGIFHFVECLILSRYKDTSKFPDAEDRLVIRALSRMATEDMSGIVSRKKWFGKKRRIEDLVTHLDIISDEDMKKAMEKANKIANVLKDVLGVDEYRVLEMLQRTRLNTFAVLSYKSMHQGRALYLGASCFNHTCETLEDYVVVFHGSTFVLRAIKDFEMKEGDQFYINYIPSQLPYIMRQEKLKNCYLFDCHCPKCEREKGKPPEDGSCPIELCRTIELRFASLPSNEQKYLFGKQCLEKMVELQLNTDDYFVTYVYAQLQTLSLSQKKYEESVMFGLKALNNSSKCGLFKQTIIYTLYNTFKQLGFQNKDHKHHLLYLKCLSLTRRIYEIHYGKDYFVTKSLRELELKTFAI